MDTATRERAERRLGAVTEACGAADPRPALRERLRQLRERAPLAFDRARAYYEERVLPALAADPEAAEGDDAAADVPPLAGWIEYARFVGELDGEGRTIRVDAQGRAADYEGGYTAGSLVIFLPDDAAVAALVALAPASPSAAQRATLDLLVGGRLAL